MADEQNRLIQERLRKRQELLEKGVNPYPHMFKPTKYSTVIKSEHEGVAPETHTGTNEIVAGRVMLLRNMGKAAFLTLQDPQGRIQAYIRSDDVGKEEYKLLKKVDLGDFLGVEGEVFTTKTGEISIYAKKFTILTKATRPLPEKFHGLQDTELKYRERYLDLTMKSSWHQKCVPLTKSCSCYFKLKINW